MISKARLLGGLIAGLVAWYAAVIAADALLVNGVGVQGGLRYGLLGAFELIAGGAIVLLAMKIAGMSPKAAGFTLEKAGSDVAIGLGITGAPETFLVDPEGRIRYKLVGPMTPEIWETDFLPRIRALRNGTAS